MRARRSPNSSVQASACQEYRRMQPGAPQQGTSEEEEWSQGAFQRNSSPLQRELAAQVPSPEPHQHPARGAAADLPRDENNCPPRGTVLGSRTWRAHTNSKRQSSVTAAGASRHALQYSLSAMLGACMAFALLLDSRLANVPVLQGWRQYMWQANGLAGDGGGFDHEQVVRELQEHVRLHGPADDFFPAGCCWRTVGPLPSTELTAFTNEAGQAAARQTWRMQQYEYWDETAEEWVPDQPAACRLQTLSPQEWEGSAWWSQSHLQEQQQQAEQQPQHGGKHQEQHREQQWLWGGPASGGGCSEAACLYSNIWYNQGKFYFVSEGPAAQAVKWAMSKNRVIDVLNVRNATAWASSVDARVVPGETAAVEYVFFLHPTAIGHWLESMFPLFSTLLHGAPTLKRTPDRLLVLQQKRGFLFGWVRALMALALGIKPGEPLPPIILQQEHDESFEQMEFPPEGVQRTEWLCFEKLLWVKDIFVNGTRGFRDTHDAQLFRRLMYEQYALPFPSPGTLPPLAVTFQRKSANRRVVNEDEMVAMLREFGKVRVVEFSSSTPFREQLATMAGTGVYVSVHTSNLANTPFLPPNAAVFEIIQRNWAWFDIDQSFVSLTRQIGDIHHYAWRAQGPNQTLYSHPRLAQLFSSWNASECVVNECVEAHTAVDVVVDVEALRRLISGRLRLIRAGASVPKARMPWPLAK